MYKVKNLLAPKHICDIFYKQFKNYDLRSNDFPTPRFNTVCYSTFFYIMETFFVTSLGDFESESDKTSLYLATNKQTKQTEFIPT